MWNKEPQAAGNSKWSTVKLRQKERGKARPDLTIKARIRKRTEVFKREAIEPREKPLRQAVVFFRDIFNRDTTLRLGRWRGVL